MRVSFTVSNGKSTSVCGMNPEMRRNVAGAMGRWFTRTIPWWRRSRPPRISRSVDFPAPLGPAIARISPGRAMQLTPFSMKPLPPFLGMPLSDELFTCFASLARKDDNPFLISIFMDDLELLWSEGGR